ncbi:MAG: hypothetical protein AAFY17_04535, partial [Cyanobacteria bacterium J06642_11]
PNAAGLTPMIDRAQTVRLGENLVTTGNLSPAAMERTLTGLRDYAAMARTYAPRKIICFGTAALRRARNRDVFCQQVKEQLGWMVRILSPEEEARYTFRGALSSLDVLTPDTASLVIDIGGGSTEIVYGRGNTIDYQTSIPMGAVIAQEYYQLQETINTTDYKEICDHLHRLWQQLPPIPPETTTLLTGGTATTLAALLQKLQDYDVAAIDGYALTRASITAQYQQLNQLSLKQRSALAGMEPGRADIILPALLILLTLLEHLEVEEVRVSGRGARYGLLL